MESEGITAPVTRTFPEAYSRFPRLLRGDIRLSVLNSDQIKGMITILPLLWIVRKKLQIHKGHNDLYTSFKEAKCVM